MRSRTRLVMAMPSGSLSCSVLSLWPSGSASAVWLGSVLLLVLLVGSYLCSAPCRVSGVLYCLELLVCIRAGVVGMWLLWVLCSQLLLLLVVLLIGSGSGQLLALLS